MEYGIDKSFDECWGPSQSHMHTGLRPPLETIILRRWGQKQAFFSAQRESEKEVVGRRGAGKERERVGGSQHISPPFTCWHGLSKKPFIRPSEQSGQSVQRRQFSWHITPGVLSALSSRGLFSSHDFHMGGLAKEVHERRASEVEKPSDSSVKWFNVRLTCTYLNPPGQKIIIIIKRKVLKG